MDLSPITLKLIEQGSTGKKLSGRLTSQIPESDKRLLITKYNVDDVIAGIYCLVNKVEPNICSCGNRTKFQSFSTGFRKFCSVSCSTKVNNSTNNIIKNNLEFDTIVSYSHRRLFVGESFIKAGFELSHKTEPGYFWANKHTSNILPRYKTQKHKLNTTLTESQYMTSQNFVKVWDCGQLVFVLNNSITNNIDI